MKIIKAVESYPVPGLGWIAWVTEDEATRSGVVRTYRSSFTGEVAVPFQHILHWDPEATYYVEADGPVTFASEDHKLPKGKYLTEELVKHGVLLVPDGVHANLIITLKLKPKSKAKAKAILKEDAHVLDQGGGTDPGRPPK